MQFHLNKKAAFYISQESVIDCKLTQPRSGDLLAMWLPFNLWQFSAEGTGCEAISQYSWQIWCRLVHPPASRKDLNWTLKAFIQNVESIHKCVQGWKDSHQCTIHITSVQGHQKIVICLIHQWIKHSDHLFWPTFLLSNWYFSSIEEWSFFINNKFKNALTQLPTNGHSLL